MRNTLTILTRSVVVFGLLSASGAGAAELAWPSGTEQPSASTVTDSIPGWRPTEAQIGGVRATTEAFFGAKDASRAADAYQLQTDGLKQMYPIGNYTDELLKFHLQSGIARRRQVIALTWSKDPPQAHTPGVYAALDFVAEFENIDRYCGYLIIYQAPAGGSFLVTREQFAFLDNATAKSIEQDHGLAGVDNAWAKASVHCPNYRKQPEPLPEQANSIGYPTIEAALEALHANPAVEFSTQASWTVAVDKSSMTIWTFAPIGDPAYPAMVKRQFFQDGAHVSVRRQVQCGATKEACDELVRRYDAIEARAAK